MGTWAVLVAAGRGERLGTDIPKAFAPLAGRALLAESLERLEASSWVDRIVVAVPAGWEEPAILLAEELGAGKVEQVVAGGPSRAESVRLGMAQVPEDALVVLVHDAARPMLTDAVIERVVGALADGWDGAVPAVPVADTIKRVSGREVVETLHRSELVAVQTPQGFVASVLRAALEGDVVAASDCSSFVEASGGRVTIVEGDPKLVKVTNETDRSLVESWLLAGRA